VVTLPGPTFAGRHSITHLINAGLPELVADSWEEYIDKAVALAEDPDALAGMRSDLREKVRNSPVCDGVRFARHLASAFRTMWHQRVAGWESGSEEWRDHIAVPAFSEKVTENSAVPVDVQFGRDQQRNEEKKVIEKTTAFPELMKAWHLPLKDDLRICVPSTIKEKTSYILLEQNQWFEPELQFILRYLKEGNSVVDLEAGYGVYSLPMADILGRTGIIWAREADLLKRAYLQKSISVNNLEWLKITGDEEDISRCFKQENRQIDFLRLACVNESEMNWIKNARVAMIERPSSSDDYLRLVNQLKMHSMRLYVYVPGVDLLTEIDDGEVPDPYVTQLIAVRENEVLGLKREGMIHDSQIKIAEAEPGAWNRYFKNRPWVNGQLEVWNSLPDDEKINHYLKALDYVSEAITDDKRGSERATYLLKAADILIDLYNAGFTKYPISVTLARVLNDLGRREQALAILRKVMEDKAVTSDASSSLPFLPPLAIQDDLLSTVSLSNWMMVRLVEAWIMISNHSAYSSSTENLKLLAGLHANPESSAMIERWFAVAGMKKNSGYFSQFGEDRVLDELLIPAQNSGFYVDVGAFDPFKYSNTARMHLFGWMGINIDANDESIARFDHFRKNDKNVHAAVTEQNGTATLFSSDKLGEVNTLSTKHKAKWQGRGVKFEKKIVPSRRLEDILRETIPEGQGIDFMNIDVEDAEMGVINSNDWERYRPKVIAVEIHEFDPANPAKDPVAAKLMSLGYKINNYAAPTGIFVDALLN